MVPEISDSPLYIQLGNGIFVWVGAIPENECIDPGLVQRLCYAFSLVVPSPVDAFVAIASARDHNDGTGGPLHQIRNQVGAIFVCGFLMAPLDLIEVGVGVNGFLLIHVFCSHDGL